MIDTDGTVDVLIWLWYPSEPEIVQDLIDGLGGVTQNGVKEPVSEKQKEILKQLFSEYESTTGLNEIKIFSVEGESLQIDLSDTQEHEAMKKLYLAESNKIINEKIGEK